MKVLIVDDEEPIRNALGRKLQRDGVNVILASSGLEGLRAFHAERPDLVVLDYKMPEMDGLTVCQRIREVSEAPIMMLSAKAINEEDVIEGLNAGADAYLIKPVRLNEFVARIQALLRRAQLSSTEADSGYNDGYLVIYPRLRHVH